MNERRVRTTGRPVYGRPQPMRPRRQSRGGWSPSFSLPPRLVVLVVVVGLALIGIRNYFEVK